MKTPVALLIFNRPDLTEKVFEAICQARPPKLLVVADGPRSDRPGEAEKCAAARAVIQGVDWDCQVLTNYSETNLGCRDRICSGLDWVFDTVEEAIILEDDCLPHPTFFRFCDELLDYYRHDTRVMHISGSNFDFLGENPQESYYFSRIAPAWGWATWRRAWQYFDADIPMWPELKNSQNFIRIFGSTQEYEYRSKNWDAIYERKLMSSWDYQWHLACLSQDGRSIIPNKNLTSNLGFREDATHTTDAHSKGANRETQAMNFPLVHPKFFFRDSLADDACFQGLHNSNFYKKVVRKFDRLSRRLSTQNFFSVVYSEFIARKA